MRLAFAVAAFLEPEILIIDEVLAVGDAEFQKKCLGRMKDVSVNDGRTVLFVSHNMEAVNNLCSKVISLSSGSIDFDGDTEEGIKRYLNNNKQHYKGSFVLGSDLAKDLNAYIESIELISESEPNNLAGDQPLKFLITLGCNIELPPCRLGLRINTPENRPVGLLFSNECISLKKSNTTKFIFELRNHNLSKGDYLLDFSIGIGNEESSVSDYHLVYNALSFGIKRKIKDSSKKITTWNSLNWGNCNYQDFSINIIK